MRLNNKVLSLALLLFSVSLLGAFTFKPWQNLPVLEKIYAKLTLFQKKYPQEKVYLHLDKPYYAAGEDVWFKAYLVDAATHVPSQLSQVLYVELIDPQDSINTRLALHIKNGLGHGDFALPDTIAAGLYRLRAYTSWMQNSDPAYFFHQNVQILNPRVDDLVPTLAFDFKRQEKGDSVLVQLALKNVKEKPQPQTSFFYSIFSNHRNSSRRKGTTNAAGEAQLRFFLPDGQARQNAQLKLTIVEGKVQTQKNIRIPLATDSIDLQFFPEGGDLINGMLNTVGFKAVNSNGLGTAVEGGLFDNTGKKVANITSLKFGMGRFRFLPEKGKNYEARITGEAGQTIVYPLPQAKTQGVLMAVDNTHPDTINIKAFLLGFTAPNSRPKSLSIVGQSRGQIYFTGHSTNPKELLLTRVPKKKFPNGIVQFTLFSDTGEPLAERLVFVHSYQNLQVALTPSKTIYKPREKVNLQLEVKSPLGQPVQGNFSLSVTDAQRVDQGQNNSSILSNLLLTSDLRGYVEQPGYYFTDTSPEAALALDNLLLTQGWRRFVWKEILSDKLPPYVAPLERGLAVSGQVLKLSGKPEPNAQITALALGKAGFMVVDTANAEGKFVMNVPPLTDSIHLVMQARNQKGRNNLEVVLDKGLPIALIKPQVPYAPTAMPYSDILWKYLQNNREQLRLDQLAGKSVLLNSVEIRGRKQTEEEAPFRSGLHTTADVTIKGEELNMSGDLLMALQGRVAGLTVFGGEISMRGGGTPLFLLDGMPIDAEYIRSISMMDVEKIEILKPGAMAAIYGGQGSNGVIAVTIKRGGSTASSSTRYKGVAFYRGIRYHTAREFYMPRYDQPNQVEQPDLRTTIFWSPTIQTDSAGKATISFFAADASTTYNAILEGVSPGGHVGRRQTSLTIR